MSCDDLLFEDCSVAYWDNFHNILGQNKLSILCFNARSILNKFTDFKTYLSMINFRFTFLLITETWLHENSNISLELPGYKSLSVYRGESQRGGGLKLFYLNNIKCTLIQEHSLCLPYVETLTVKCLIPSFGSLVIVGVYRPPQGDMDSFLLSLQRLVDVHSG